MTLTLPEILAIQSAAELKTQWLALLDADDADKSLSIQAGALTKVDGTGIALLLALLGELTKRELSWSWADSSAVLDEAAADMGVAQHLQPSS